MRWAGSELIVVSIVLAIATTAVPVHADGLGADPYLRSPCVGFGILPPHVYADPNCANLYHSMGRHSDVSVRAVNSDIDTQVTWDYAGDAVDVARFFIYKGHTPETMSLIAVRDASAEWRFEDDNGIVRNGAVWYKVTAELVDKTKVASNPTLIEFVVTI